MGTLRTMGVTSREGTSEALLLESFGVGEVPVRT